MSSDLTRRGNSEPERWWRTRAERTALRNARLKAELDDIETMSDVERARIRAAGRAQLHRERLRYTAVLTDEAAEQYEQTHDDIRRKMDGRPADQMLNIGLAAILGVSLEAFKGEIEEHRRDGRELGL